jgi:hypothetical protein
MSGYRKRLALPAAFALLAFALGACAADKEEKYELKSPCVAADKADGPSPCARRPANPRHPYEKIAGQPA